MSTENVRQSELHESEAGRARNFRVFVAFCCFALLSGAFASLLNSVIAYYVCLLCGLLALIFGVSAAPYGSVVWRIVDWLGGRTEAKPGTKR